MNDAEGRTASGAGRDSDCFDAAAAWERLPSEAQRAIGIAALVYAVGEVGACLGLEGASSERETLAFDAARLEGSLALGRLAISTVLATEVWKGALPPRPDLAAIGVRSCEGCGCTDECGCPAGCFWVGPRLCSACAA